MNQLLSFPSSSSLEKGPLLWTTPSLSIADVACKPRIALYYINSYYVFVNQHFFSFRSEATINDHPSFGFICSTASPSLLEYPSLLIPYQWSMVLFSLVL